MNRLKFAEDNSMEGKTCLVTGASRRIGFQTALGLARKHALIVLAGHNRQLGEKAGRRINAHMRKATDSILLQPLIRHAHAAGQDGSNEN